jgi:hypothetical protein
LTTSLIKEASVHAKKSKQRGITADGVRKVAEVGFLSGFKAWKRLTVSSEESYEI